MSGLNGISKAKIEKRLAEIKAKAGTGASKSADPAKLESKPVTADEIVLWNTHDRQWNDRGVTRCNVELRRAGKTVWSQNDIEVTWSDKEEPATEIAIPKIAFDTVHIEITAWVQWGAALCEVEVLKGRKNIAIGKPITASGERGECTAAKVVDGIRVSDERSGVWWAPDHQPAWIEVHLASSE